MPTLSEIFETMEYGPAPESASEALAWIATHEGRFGHFINGTFTAPAATFVTVNPATDAELAQVSQGSAADIAAAVAAARAAQPAWEKAGGPARARVLYAIARLLQKHARLFAVLETLDNGKPIRESRDADIPLAQRHFYYHAGLAQLFEAQNPNARAHGVCGQIIPWNFPLLMLAWKVAPALAAGNTVVLKPAEYTPLTALLFAEVCQQAGVPAGVVNIVTGDGDTGAALVAADVNKIAFTGSTEVGRIIRQATAGSGKALTLELGGKSPFIVFDDADLDAAVEGVVDSIWFNQGQVCCAGSRLLLHEPIAARFIAKLKRRMESLRIGDPLDKSIDIGAIVHPVQLQRITALVGAHTAGEVHTAPCPLPARGSFYPPTLITGLSPSDALMQQEIFGPVLVSTTFRTPAEAVELANNTRYGLAASVFSENINTALAIAPQLEAGVIWVNGANMLDAAAPFGGMRESGYGREGGPEGLAAYTRMTNHAAPALKSKPVALPVLEQVDRTAKLYIGGKQARPDSGYSIALHDTTGALAGHVGAGSRKDLRNAVEAMNAAKGWAKTTGHNRAQILYFIAENLSARAAEFAALIDSFGGAGAAEVSAAIDALFTAAAVADKYDGRVAGVPFGGLALALQTPVGKIAALCPEDSALLAPVALIAGALALGSRITLVPSARYALVATALYQVLDTSDVPGGVVNIITGVQSDLAAPIAQHADLDAAWVYGDQALVAEVERLSASNLKRVSSGPSAPDMAQILRAASEVKTIWIPFGI
ncbi:aldehyde dehydrogenase family protein [Ketogulonicigenium vulgare]|uniref:Aldehyde dehydrogenase family protein, putative n=1 Tax=Ketogulonicigenium vulgare (strain WSH-001) TaxID=759362 RepID=F9Y408_KETVW|nr:aldehyde dehydrogenase family protein [Ketogulonicigenium vulgare]ADO43413.1 aldehyde dehydrogenase family protein, putative [Ketogulonicigenium vulgare Y25]AEM41699.1 Aldehyde dehydrogenase family protein, putative [Ketogulonicigenium vulgare WSH-001]ALJ81807.1 aldehyde dehydrogenase [Ketogulonicigenium vulgare]ANW34461.1 aldehyde dehydrogenase [Ketogulonicigenium vulgare]AOZ55449.1 aldehyde dehydrogenase family protein, putative [Ketogulonicigenium vulgare]